MGYLEAAKYFFLGAATHIACFFMGAFIGVLLLCVVISGKDDRE